MELIAYLLASVGLTVLIIWPEGGPGAFFREKVFRRVLPAHGCGDRVGLTVLASIFAAWAMPGGCKLTTRGRIT